MEILWTGVVVFTYITRAGFGLVPVICYCSDMNRLTRVKTLLVHYVLLKENKGQSFITTNMFMLHLTYR